jgi:hypothetical protein
MRRMETPCNSQTGGLLSLQFVRLVFSKEYDASHYKTFAKSGLLVKI